MLSHSEGIDEQKKGERGGREDNGSDGEMSLSN